MHLSLTTTVVRGIKQNDALLFHKFSEFTDQIRRFWSPNSSILVCKTLREQKREAFGLSFVIRLGLEPKTPTLKVLCSTN